jgi:hypothetical protein
MEALLHNRITKEIFKMQQQLIKADEQAQENETRMVARMEEIRLQAAQKREKDLKIALEQAQRAEEKMREREVSKEQQELAKLVEKARKEEECEWKATERAKKAAVAKVKKMMNKAVKAPTKRKQARAPLTNKMLQSKSRPSRRVNMSEGGEDSETASKYPQLVASCVEGLQVGPRHSAKHVGCCTDTQC